MAKRKRAEQVDDSVDLDTPRTNRTTRSIAASSPAETPSKVRSILRNSTGAKKIDEEPTPKSLRRVLFSTAPRSLRVDDEEDEIVAADRGRASPGGRIDGARRRAQSVTSGSEGRDELDELDIASHGEDSAIAMGGSALADTDVHDEDVEETQDSAAPTPRKRGRPKGRRRERTPSPPPDLPPHELYFFHHRPGQAKTSANTLPTGSLLNHENYLAALQAYADPHQADMAALESLHHRAFDQWMFELQEGFSLCLYGYGSKRGLVIEFLDHVSLQSERKPKIVVANGYTPGLIARDVLSVVAGLVLPTNTKLPAQPNSAVDLILSTMDQQSNAASILLAINSLDHVNLRKSGTQALLARLSSHPRIRLLATCDTPNFPLLWDIGIQQQFRWIYHDTTTFAPFTVELDAVEDVSILLGRSTRRLGGKDGVAYVLRSLPDNAQSLFRILVAEQLALDGDVGANAADGDDGSDIDDILGAIDEDEAAALQDTPSRRGRKRATKPSKAAKASAKPSGREGVEYRMLYHKAVEEFVCSSEISFRTLLKEFHDHQMVESRKDSLGTERLIVPFRREDLEAILEELC